MTSTKHKPHGKETADETACAGRRRAAITALARGVACSLCVLAGGGLLTSASTATPNLRPAAATVAGPALAVKPVRAHRAAIGLFTATPARLPASGGKVRLVAVVQGAASCRLSAAALLVQLPATKPCSSGNVSFSVVLPRNHSSSSRTYRFHLTATADGSSANAGPAWVVEGGTASAVDAAPTITTEPTGRSVFASGTVSFTAAARGKPAPSVRWQVSGNGGRGWSNIAGATASTYSFRAQSADSGDEYRAVFTNSVGSARTTVATLTVVTTHVGTPVGPTNGIVPTPTAQVAPSVPTPPASQSAVSTTSSPQITQQPQSTTVTAGSTASFAATASGTPTPSVQWEISTNGGSYWSDISGATSATLSFTAAAGDNGYEFEAIFSNGTLPNVQTNPVTLTVESAPTVTQNPASQSVAAGQTASFTAAASGTPTPTVQWQVSSDSGNSWTDISGATSATYSFATSAGQTGNEYRASFTNSIGSATTDPATLTVTTSAPMITAQPSRAAVVGDSTASFTAGASGSPAPTVQWYVSMDGGSSWSAVANANSSTYSFAASGSESGYEYEAEFSNPYGNATTNPATLVVGTDTAFTNWSGYAVTGSSGSVTQASGSWNVSSVNCSGAGTTYSAEWVGIDGYPTTNPTVEQDGTDSDCSGGTASYYAWYEMYGDSSLNGGDSIELSKSTYPVSAGDSMTATISVSGDMWTLSLTDGSKGWNFETSPAITFSEATETSAEWVVERPSVGSGLTVLSNFGTSGFSGATATIGGQSGSIAHFSGVPLEMESTNGSTLLALPSALGLDGASFSDTFYNSN
jgi:hypothetical protein